MTPVCKPKRLITAHGVRLHVPTRISGPLHVAQGAQVLSGVPYDLTRGYAWEIETDYHERGQRWIVFRPH